MDKEENKDCVKEEKDMAIPLPKTKVETPYMAKMKQMAQEAIQKKGLTDEDINQILGIKRNEK